MLRKCTNVILEKLCGKKKNFEKILDQLETYWIVYWKTYAI